MKSLFAPVVQQARDYQAYWHKTMPGELTYVVLGDSAALGVGAPDPQQGYVGLLAGRLMRATGKSVAVRSFAVSGERSADLLRRQIPQFDAFGNADFVTCVVGGNDVAFSGLMPDFPVDGYRETMAAILDALPSHAIVGNVPSFRVWPFEPKVKAANAALRDLTEVRGIALADIYSATRKPGLLRYLTGISGDGFHPNARGYKLWADALWPHLEAQL